MAGYKLTKSDLEDQIWRLETELAKALASNERKRQRLAERVEDAQKTVNRLRADRNHYRSLARELEGVKERGDEALRDVLILVGAQTLGLPDVMRP